jgi:hypothetical protein
MVSGGCYLCDGMDDGMVAFAGEGFAAMMHRAHHPACHQEQQTRHPHTDPHDAPDPQHTIV